MANLTIAQLRAVSIPPASMDIYSTPGTFVMDYVFDGSKQALAASDTADMFEIPAYCGVIIQAAAVTVIKPGSNASATLGISLGAAAAAGTAVTGLTGWDVSSGATAGTQLVKLQTAANTIISTNTSNYIKIQISTAALGTGVVKVRVFGQLLAPISNVS